MRINRSLGAGRGRRRILTSLFASVLAVGATVLPASPAFAYTCKVNALLDPSDSQIQALFDSGPSTVTFYGLCDGNFVIERALTVVGASGAIVEGDGGGSVFDVSGPFSGTLTFRGLKITGGNGAVGSGLWITDAAVVLDKVTIYENEATDVGGGVFADPGSSLTITASVFRANAAEEGGAIFAYSPRLSITGSSFLGNVSDYVGGAIAFDADGGGYDGATGYDAAPSAVAISRSTFTGNTTGEDGGAVFIDSADSVISGSTFSRNVTLYDDGGALALYDDQGIDPISTITSSNFTFNTSDDDGGGVYAYGYDRVNVTGGRFTSNVSGDDGGGLTGDDTTLVVTSTTFTSNRSDEEGGALYVSDDFNADGTFIDRSTFTGNVSSDEEGGAVSIDDSDLTLTASTFTRNTAGGGDDGNGGAVAVNDGDCDIDAITVTGSRFVSNSAPWEGGAIYVDDDCDDNIDMVVTGSTFTGNSTGDSDGGAIMAYDTWVVVRGSTFSSNRSGEDGGAVSVEYGGFASDARTTFSGNRAAQDGGAVELDDMESRNSRPSMLFSGRYIGNVAAEDGGAIDLEQCDDFTTMEFSAVTIERNTAGRWGGGVHAYEYDCGGLDILVYDNTSALGGEWGTLDQGPVSISYNKAVDPIIGAGGAMYLGEWDGGCCIGEVLFATSDDDPGTITIQRNSAAEAGGLYIEGYYDGSGDLYLDYGVLVAYNTYGGVYEPYCNVPGLQDATYIGNTGYDYTC